MPTYEYACRECGAHLEVVQSFKDAALTTCPTCGGPLRKVFAAAGIIFKGSGYYVTDSRGKKAAEGSGDGAPAKEAAASSAGDGGKAGGGSDGGGASSGESASSSAGASSGGGSSSGSGSSSASASA